MKSLPTESGYYPARFASRNGPEYTHVAYVMGEPPLLSVRLVDMRYSVGHYFTPKTLDGRDVADWIFGPKLALEDPVPAEQVQGVQEEPEIFPEGIFRGNVKPLHQPKIVADPCSAPAEAGAAPPLGTVRQHVLNKLDDTEGRVDGICDCLDRISCRLDSLERQKEKAEWICVQIEALSARMNIHAAAIDQLEELDLNTLASDVDMLEARADRQAAVIEQLQDE